MTKSALKKKELGIVGTGKAGANIAYWLSRCGWKIRTVYDIVPERAQEVANAIPTGVAPNLESVFKRCDIVFITVPESEMIKVLEQIQELSNTRTRTLAHTSGVLPASILELAGLEFAKCSLHPMLSIPKLNTLQNPFRGVSFAVEGDDSGIDFAKNIVNDLDCKFWKIEPGMKPIYHAASVFATNFIYSLIAIAEELFRQAGFPEEIIPRFISSAITHSMKNYLEHGFPDGITGPLVRDDYETISIHLLALKDSDFISFYCEAMRVLADILGKRKEFEQTLEKFGNL